MKFLFDKIQLPDDKNYIVKDTSKETISLFLFNLVNTSNQDIIFVTNTLYEANKVYQSLLNYTNNVFLFPMDEFLTSEAIAISPELKTTRIETINNIVQVKDKKIIITHLMGLLRYLPSKEIWQNSIIEKIGRASCRERV